MASPAGQTGPGPRLGHLARPGIIRLGVVIGVPEPCCRELQEARERYGDPHARAIRPHVTLLAPLDIDGAAMDEVMDHLSAVARRFEPFVMHLRGTATFRPVSPVVFVQVVRGIAECEQLERAVRRGPLAADLRFNYHPHVTIAHDVGEENLDRAFDEMAGFEVTFAVGHFDLYVQDAAAVPCATAVPDGEAPDRGGGPLAVWRLHETFELVGGEVTATG